MKKILFIDDDSRVLAGIRRLLYSRRGDWHVDCAASPVLALELLSKQSFHVVISDLQMPGIDGASVLEFAQKRCPAATRIVLSGEGDADSAARVARVAHMYLTKPCGETALIETITRALMVQDLLGDDELRGVVGGIGALPAAPRLHRKLELTLAESGCDLDAVAGIIECDAAICAKVLQVVNSAFFGIASKVCTVRQAVGFLGVEALRSLVLGAEVQRMADGMKLASGFDLDTYQSHSLSVAVLAKDFVHGKDQAALAFTVGVLHDVGDLLLASHAPNDFVRLRSEIAEFEAARCSPDEFSPAHDVHARLGAALLAMWGLPASIVDMVRSHHGPVTENPDEPIAIAEAIALAELVERVLRKGLVEPGVLADLGQVEERLTRRGIVGGAERLRAHVATTAATLTSP